MDLEFAHVGSTDNPNHVAANTETNGQPDGSIYSTFILEHLPTILGNKKFFKTVQ
jgi:hypothetical protein